MATKSQHASAYRPLPDFLRALREEAGLTQRELGKRMQRPQSWIYNCETANRRVDVTEFIEWATQCGLEARDAFSRFLQGPRPSQRTGKRGCGPSGRQPKATQGSG